VVLRLLEGGRRVGGGPGRARSSGPGGALRRAQADSASVVAVARAVHQRSGVAGRAAGRCGCAPRPRTTSSSGSVLPRPGAWPCAGGGRLGAALLRVRERERTNCQRLRFARASSSRIAPSRVPIIVLQPFAPGLAGGGRKNLGYRPTDDVVQCSLQCGKTIRVGRRPVPTRCAATRF
jgi:hypothetical protein